MKSLIQYILEIKDSFTSITTEWMISNYDRFNKMYFNNDLPHSSEIDIQYTYNSSIKGTTLGCQGFHRACRIYYSKMKNGMYMLYDTKSSINDSPITNLRDLDPFIYINKNVPMTIDKYEDTLIHEMIHLWVSRNCLYPKHAHGKEFKAKCKEIREIAKTRDGKDYELTTYAQKENGNYDYTEVIKTQLKNKKNLKNIVGMFIEFNTNKLKDPRQGKIYTFCSRNTSKKFIQYIKNEYGKYNPTIYITEDSYEKICMYCQTLFKTFTTFRYWILDNYKEERGEKEFIYKIMTNTTEIIKENQNEIDESYWNERPRKLTKEDVKGIMYIIPADTDLSDFDTETDAVAVKLPDGKKLDDLFK